MKHAADGVRVNADGPVTLVGPINEFHALMEQPHRYLAAGRLLVAGADVWMAGAAGRQEAVVDAAIFGYAIWAHQPEDLVVAIRAR